MTATDIPTIQSVGDTFILTWQQHGIQVELNRFVEKSEGVSAELVITKGEGHLYQARVNLLSPASKRTLANEMSSRLGGIDWRVIVEQAFTKTLERYRKGQPVIKVGNLPKREAPRYRLKPFVLENELNAIYAYGGAGKSILSHLIAILVQCGVSACGLIPNKGNTLILDWETSKETVDERVKALKKGMKISSPELPYYRHCYHVLASDIYEIQEEIASKNIQLIVVDSANMASGVTSDFHGPAQAMLAALRSINRSVLIIDHKPKQGESMFGTVIKFNSCRSAWEMEGTQEEESRTLQVALTHTKHNDIPKMRPIGFNVEFIGDDDYIDEIVFKREDIMANPQFAKKRPLKDRIYHLLLHEGLMSVSEITSELEDTIESSVRAVLNRYRDKLFIKKDDKWGVKEKRT
ncbi:MAG: AAA family ATPase [Dehalococcoidia bacterium]